MATIAYNRWPNAIHIAFVSNSCRVEAGYSALVAWEDESCLTFTLQLQESTCPAPLIFTGEFYTFGNQLSYAVHYHYNLSLHVKATFFNSPVPAFSLISNHFVYSLAKQRFYQFSGIPTRSVINQSNISCQREDMVFVYKLFTLFWHRQFSSLLHADHFCFWTTFVQITGKTCFLYI